MSSESAEAPSALHSTPIDAQDSLSGSTLGSERGSEQGNDRGSDEGSVRRTDRMFALVLFALALALYLRGGARDVLQGDPGEFQFAAWNFGVAHATGYPLYLMLGGIWQRLLGIVGINPAHALNMLSAVFGAAAVGLLFWVVVRWAPGTPAIRRAAAMVAAAYLLTNPTFWSQALIAEVYTLHALFVVLILWALQSLERSAPGQGNPVWLALVMGLSLTHHATTVLFVPALAVALWLLRDRLTRNPGQWIFATIVLLAPLLLYLYVPLRATPAASPWYFPRLGGESLALFQATPQGIFDFVTGRSISVGFTGALVGERLGDARTLWGIHLGWVGIVLALFGMYAMWVNRRRALLFFVLVAVAALQLFNLFYAIDDILVYYIPLYVLAVVAIGFGAGQLGNWFVTMAQSSTQSLAPGGVRAESAPAAVSQPVAESAPAAESESTTDGAAADSRPINWELIGVIVIVALIYFPLRQASTYADGLSQARVSARAMWESVLAANPEQGAILVSNDRNEIVPLYYMQTVEDRRPDLTGIFPLIAPEQRFVDIGATTATALASGAPVYLIKPMPGIESRFALETATEPLTRVTGDAAANSAPQVTLNQPYAGLTLIGYDLLQNSSALAQFETPTNGAFNQVRLYWRVDSALPAAYTTTVQAYDDAGNKTGQSDVAAGGQYYPTSLWKPGEALVETHTLQPVSAGEPAPSATSLLVGMYTGANAEQLAPPLLITLPGAN